jgi:hypothetical protein
MTPNRIAARFISGGRHQTFGSILGAPFRQHTVTSGKNRRKQYQAHKRRQQRAAAAEKRRVQRQAAAERRRAAAARKSAPKPPRKPRPKSPPIAVNPRTGKPITYAQAAKALREAQERAERLAAGLPSDPPGRRPRKTAAKKAVAPKPKPRRKPRPTPRNAAAARPRAPRTAPLPPDPGAAPGKSLRGVYYAATCPCQGTGRIAAFKDGRVSGSTSCEVHGRRARGGRKVLARRAVKNAGLPGVAAWLGSRRGGNSDKQQQRAARAAERRRYAGPSEPCRACDGEGTVNRELTEGLRAAHIARVVADHEFAGRRPPGARKLEALARKGYPYDRCRVCAGLGRVASAHSGWWHRDTDLPQAHRLTGREAATGKRRR